MSGPLRAARAAGPDVRVSAPHLAYRPVPTAHCSGRRDPRPRRVQWIAAALLAVSVLAPAAAAQSVWAPDDTARPRPPVVTPAPAQAPVPPPADAIVLFDGRDLSQWASDADSGAARWLVRDGYMEIVPGSGGIHTRRAFGSMQLHIEFMTPTPPRGEGQERGNSGVYLMSHYEIQVLDSYQNVTYADGQAGAVYGQTPPLVNPARPPGEWQTYDIVFHRPIIGADGRVLRPATVTVLYNGVLVQDHTVITGWTVNQAVARYRPQPDRLPLALQDHGHPVRYRDIWVREIPDEE